MKSEKQSGISRRKFLKGAAAVGAAAGFPYVVSSSALGKGGSVAASNRIVMAAIGTGSMGTADLRGFLGHREVQVVAVCDVDDRHSKAAKEAVDERYGNSDCRVYKDYREVTGRGDIDAVTHALPDHWHGPVAIACAEAGIDMYGQKPLARTIATGRAICEAVKQYGIVWQTGSWQRSVRHFWRACELVRNGRIGKVNYVEVGLPDGPEGREPKLLAVPDYLDWDMWLGPAPWRAYQDFGQGDCHWDWRWIMDYSGGQLTDWAGHHVDIAHWGLGMDRMGPVEIEGKGWWPEDGLYDTPYAYDIKCRYANGLQMRVANQSRQPKGRGTVWYGEKGWIHVNRSGLWASDEKVLKEQIGAGEIHLYRSDNHYGNFIDCVKSRAETITPVEVAHRSISVGLLGEIAMLTGRKLTWDPATERFTNDADANRYLERPMRAAWRL